MILRSLRRLSVGLNYFGAGQTVNVVSDYHVANPNYNGWFNTSAFGIAAPWTLGQAPRFFSDLRAPNYDNWDMGIQKFFPIRENLRIQFRVDFFNAFNHANFYAPNMSLLAAVNLEKLRKHLARGLRRQS